MLFSSLTFLYIFLPLTLLFFYFAKSLKMKNWVLLLTSLLFYSWGEPVWIFLMLTDVFVAWITSYFIDRFNSFKRNILNDENEEDKDSKVLKINQYKKIILGIGITFCLSFLFLFKYSPFFLGVFYSIGLLKNIYTVALPIGISFFTFQIITYLVDVYREDVRFSSKFQNLLLYVSFFPQLIAGPIVRYKDIEMQIEDRTLSLDKVQMGLVRFIIGLGKKILIANYLGLISSQILDSANLGISASLELWFGLLAYTLQIYFDFSGYSDMAIGLALFFGFTLKENFNYPYISNSITDFWKRWHISLGAFFRDYLYIPMGGKYYKQFRNILIVWLLTGFWHGASWNFLLWGLYYFLFIYLEKTILLQRLEKQSIILRRFYSFIIVMIGWVFFYFTDVASILQMLTGLFFPFANGVINQKALSVIGGKIVFVLLALIGATPIPARLCLTLFSMIGKAFPQRAEERLFSVQNLSDGIEPVSFNFRPTMEAQKPFATTFFNFDSQQVKENLSILPKPLKTSKNTKVVQQTKEPLKPIKPVASDIQPKPNSEVAIPKTPVIDQKSPKVDFESLENKVVKNDVRVRTKHTQHSNSNDIYKKQEIENSLVEPQTVSNSAILNTENPTVKVQSTTVTKETKAVKEKNHKSLFDLAREKREQILSKKQKKAILSENETTEVVNIENTDKQILIDTTPEKDLNKKSNELMNDWLLKSAEIDESDLFAEFR